MENIGEVCCHCCENKSALFPVGTFSHNSHSFCMFLHCLTFSTCFIVEGYGQSGPYNQRGGYDTIAAGLGGLMHITGPNVCS